MIHSHQAFLQVRFSFLKTIIYYPLHLVKKFLNLFSLQANIVTSGPITGPSASSIPTNHIVITSLYRQGLSCSNHRSLVMVCFLPLLAFLALSVLDHCE